MNFDLCTIGKVNKIMETLKSNSSRIDGLSLRGLKAFFGYILPYLVFIINIYLEKDKIPEQLKSRKS